MGYPKGIPPSPPPRGGGGSSTYCANLSKIAAWVVVSVVGVDVAVVLRPIVDRLCDIVAGGTVIVVAVVRTVELLWRDGGEAGDFVLRINHRIHAYRVDRKTSVVNDFLDIFFIFFLKKVLTRADFRGKAPPYPPDKSPPDGGVGTDLAVRLY